MLERLFSRWVRKGFSRRPRSHRPAALSLEQLEDRCLLAASTWKPGMMTDGLWSTKPNWTNGRPGIDPGIDTAVFDGSASSVNCTFDVPEKPPINLKILSSYTGTLNLGKIMTVKGGSMAGGMITGFDLIITGGGFDWEDGTIRGAALHVLDGGILNIQKNGFKLERDLEVEDNGKVFLENNADLQAKRITIHSGGLFDIKADRGIISSWPLTNDGTFMKSGGTGVSTITSTFANNKQFEIKSGTVNFTGTATQDELASATKIFNGCTLATTSVYTVNFGGFLE